MTTEQFKELLTQASNKLDVLEHIDYEELRMRLQNLRSDINDFRTGGESLLQTNDVLQIGVVGHMNVGKSSFLNALFFDGEPVLPRAATTMTAGLSFIEYDDSNRFEVEFYTKEEWGQFEEYAHQYKEILDTYKKKNPNATDRIAKREIEKDLSSTIIAAYEMVTTSSSTAKKKVGKKAEEKSFSDKSELKEILNRYVGIHGDFTHVVKWITIKMHDERLKGIRIVDTPGTSDPVPTREVRTQQALNTCHGVFLLSYSGQFFSSDDQSFVRKTLRNKGIARIVILASKFDAALEQEGFNKKELDLKAVADTLMNSFRERVNKTLEEDEVYDAENIKVDYTSNIEQLIGFIFDMSESDRKILLNKKESELTIEEQERRSILKTIYNLKKIYTGWFDSDEEIKENCNGISNFDVIHDSYLEDVFRSHKDEIIEEKVEKYLEGQRRGIVKTVDSMYGYFSRYRADLEGAEISQLQATRYEGEALFLKLRLQFEGVIRDYQNHLKRNIKKMLLSINIQDIRQLPTTYTTGPVRCKGMLFGHNRPNITYRQVDTYNLKEKCKQSIVQYATSVIKKWESFFDEQTEKLKKDLIKCVFDYMGKIQSSSFNNDTFTNVISETMSNMLPISVLDLNDTVSKYVSLTDDLSYRRFSMYDFETEDYKKSQLPNRISSLFSEYEKGMLKSIATTTIAYKDDVQDSIDKKLDSIIEEIDSMRTNFSTELNSSLNNYICKLEADIQEKQTILDNLDMIIRELEELKSLFK